MSVNSCWVIVCFVYHLLLVGLLPQLFLHHLMFWLFIPQVFFHVHSHHIHIVRCLMHIHWQQPMDCRVIVGFWLFFINSRLHHCHCVYVVLLHFLYVCLFQRLRGSLHLIIVRLTVILLHFILFIESYSYRPKTTVHWSFLYIYIFFYLLFIPAKDFSFQH